MSTPDQNRLREGLRRSREAARSLATLDSADPVEIRRTALRSLIAAAESDTAECFRIAAIDGAQTLVDLVVEGERRDEVIRVMTAAPRSVWSQHDVARPPLPELAGFWSPLQVFPREVFEATPVFQLMWAPLRVADHTATFVYHGGAFVAIAGTSWIGGSKAVDMIDRESLAPLCPAINTAFVAAHCLARIGLPDEPVFLMLRPDGTVEHASADGSVWLAREGIREALRQRIRELDRKQEPAESSSLEEAETRIVRLDTREGVRYLACLRPLQLYQRSPADILTPLQLEIASSAAAGATAEEIARAMDRSVETIRDHMAEIYRRLRVSSRVELARILSSSPTGH